MQWYVIITTFNMPWHHFQRHSPVRRSPWAWLRKHICPGGGRMVSIVTMCHVRRTQMLCCWQQHAPSGNCQHCQQNAKNAHLMSQDPVGWYVLICLWWQYGSSRYPKPTYIQSGNMHMYPVWVYFLCTLIVCAQYTSKGGGTCNYMVHRSKQTVIRKCMSKCMECSQ